MSDPILPRPARKRTAHNLSRIEIVMVLACLAAAAALVLGYRRHQALERLQAALEEVDRATPRWRLADIEAQREEVPDEDNAAPVADTAAKRLPGNWDPYRLDRYFPIAPNIRLSSTATRKLDEELQALEPALAVAMRLERLPRGRFSHASPQDDVKILLKAQVQLPRVAVLLYHEVLRQMQAGRTNEAVRACLAGLNLARAIGDEPNAVSQTIRIRCTLLACRAAQRLLGQAVLDLSDLQRLQQAFAAEIAPNLVHIGLQGEQALRHALLEAIEAGDKPTTALLNGNLSEPPWTMKFLTELDRGDVLAIHPHYFTLMAPRVEASLLPLHEQEKANRALDAACRAVPTNLGLVMTLVPWVRTYSQTCVYHHAVLRCLTAALAAESYHRAHGSWPASLESLLTQLPAGASLDPFDGRPLRFKHLADGLVIYTLGPDHRDNGGRLDPANLNRRGTDVGIRLWDVAQRGVP